MTDSEQLARTLAELADSKKAVDIVVLDMRELVSYTDFLVICTAGNERQAGAIREAVELGLKRESGLLASRVEGSGPAGWTLLDYLDCVLHVFTEEARGRYRLEELWSDAPRIELEQTAASSASARAH
jgi:ribosome-associated protein